MEVEGLLGLLLAGAVDHDVDGLRRLPGGEGQRAGLGDVAFTGRGDGPAQRWTGPLMLGEKSRVVPVADDAVVHSNATLVVEQIGPECGRVVEHRAVLDRQ